MRLTRRTEREGEEIGRLPMTTMIDVVFLLLIFFMVTTTFTKRESQVGSALAAERRGGAAADLQPQIVRVEMAGTVPVFRIGQHVLTERGQLVAVLRELPKDGGVFIRVSGDVPWDAAAVALQAGVDAGFTKRTYVPAN
ncbi:MAG: biopolymer transporter ExbD [Phycisphaeraceae bacterium]|nr:biopolymer transporter ExbD [Phycisphaeraceae bacterium]